MFKNRHISLLLCMGFLAGCGQQVEQRFNKFCEENISALPEELIQADAIELRGSYNSVGTRILYDGIFDFLEFRIGDDPNLNLVWQRPDQAPTLPSGAYRMSLFEQVGPECRLWASAAIEKPMRNDEDISDFYGNEPCVGVTSVEVFDSEFYALRLEDHSFRRISLRKVKADTMSVFRSSDSKLVGDVERYMIGVGLPILYFEDWRYCETDVEGTLSFHDADVLRYVFK